MVVHLRRPLQAVRASRAMRWHTTHEKSGGNGIDRMAEG